jgi:hypothetical protein
MLKAPTLECLYLNANAIGDRGMVALAGCAALRDLIHLSCAGNHVSDTGAAALLHAMAPGGNLGKVRHSIAYVAQHRTA